MEPGASREFSGKRPWHGRAFRLRRFVNWCVLGMTYAVFYASRYNVNVAKGAIDKRFFHGAPRSSDFIACGLITYAVSEFFTGTIADRIGGRRAILLGAAGTTLFTFALGLLFLGGLGTGTLLLVELAVLYSVSQLFQSFGAMSVVKVNAPWFHVAERGVFGGVFGVILSVGIAFAYRLSGWLVSTRPIYWIFLVPAALSAVMLVASLLFVRDRPSHAGFADFPTGDASDGDEAPVDFRSLLRRVLGSPVLRVVMAAELCTGIVRETLMLEFPDWLAKAHHIPIGSPRFQRASDGITLGAIGGALLAGWLSDRVFDSRRPPVAFFYYLVQAACFVALGSLASPVAACAMIGFTCAWIFGVHGMLSGTVSMDFGGQKAAATAAGMMDGIQYLGAGVLAEALPWIIDRWGYRGWSLTAVPFSLIGAVLMLRVWNAKPRPRTAGAEAPPAPPRAAGAYSRE